MNQESLRTVLQSDLLLAELSRSGRLLWANEALMGATPLASEESATADLGDIHDDVTRPEVRAAVERAAGGVATVVLGVLRPRASEAGLPVRWQLLPTPGGTIVAIGTDRTELTRVEERGRRVFEASGSGMLLVDESGAIEMANEEASRVLGYAREELLGTSVEALVPASTRARHQGNRHGFHADPRPRKMASNRDLTAVRKDGTEVPVEVGLTPLFLDEAPKVLVTLVDLTARKEVERMKGEFVSTVSHELRTPLTSIRGSLRILQSQIKGELTEGSRRLVEIATSNTERLIRLINDILDIEKMQAGRLELKMSEQNARRLVETAVEAVRAMADVHGVHIHVVDGPSMRLLADPDRLVQVLCNFLSNAIKYSPRDETISVAWAEHGADVRVTVTDRGPGILPKDIPRLFGKFQQIDSSDSRSKGGTGLGLAISKAIVEQHGGHVGVDSVAGEGSTFYFQLPALPPSNRRLIAAADRTGGPRPLLLLVEDDAGVAMVISHYVRDIFDVEHVATLASARAHLAEHTPALVLLDLSLPDGDGLSLLHWLRSQDNLANVPVVIVSGRDPGDSNPTASDWIHKPFDEASLLRTVRRVVGGRDRADVLLVEDDEGTREVIEAELLAAGLTVRVASTGRMALELLDACTPDLIVLDVGLPDLDGFDVVSLLRSSVHRTTPLLVYSGRDLSPHDRAELTLGETVHITKGSTNDDLLARARELLAGLAQATQTPRRGPA